MAQTLMASVIRRLWRPKKAAHLCHIYTADKGGDKMISHQQIEAVKNTGLYNDRYATQKGYWHYIESCQVTLISLEDLKSIERKSKLSMKNGIHRRNLVVSNIPKKLLQKRKFQIGSAIFEYEKPRPPCGYIDGIAGKGMAKALGRQSGICAQVVKSGCIKIGDTLIIQ